MELALATANRNGAERARQLARSGRFANSFAVQAELSAEEELCMSETFFRSEIDRLCKQARAGSNDS
jgi:hypothetical protein